MTARRRRSFALTAALVVALTGAAAPRPAPDDQITAYFHSAVAVYPGSDVRVLGVKVGEIASVTPEGTQVRAVLTLDDGVDVPAAATAVVVAPALVAERYIQLSPAYTSGPKLAPGAVLPADRTAVPMELDKLYETLSDFSRALGPTGANKEGSLSRVLDVGAANLKGNGRDINTMVAEFGKASKTLADSSGDLFATVRHLADFSRMLRANDDQVRLAEQQLADVTGFLAADRDEIGGALHELAGALGEVKTFVAENRTLLATNVDKLADLTQTLVNQRRSLAEALDSLPLAATNVVNAYDPETRTVMGRGDLLELMFGPAARALDPKQIVDPAPTPTAGATPEAPKSPSPTPSPSKSPGPKSPGPKSPGPTASPSGTAKTKEPTPTPGDELPGEEER
ncbi:MCE family protein [Nonomuraea sp. NPDC050394]|uniref:MCE family protein n=1 Tax=Nonomuraea sp. NPDC050394 TaxID=3364363 RepID=UPI0037A87C20